MSEAQLSQILLADKPVGISSHAAVARARRALGLRRIGHAGTLDPFASGLLILLVGRATRLARWFTGLPKTYEVLIRLGYSSSTGDVEGVITPGRMPPRPLPLPHGVISQRPPAYSAVKVDGERAYRLARRGVAVELAPRQVEIHEAVELWREGERAALRITCSSGTYVRALVAELGDAYCLQLRRTAIGPFVADGAWPTQGPAALTELAPAWRAIGGATPQLSAEQVRLVVSGRPLEGVAAPAAGPLPLLLLDAAGAPVALAEPRADGRLAPIVGLRGAGLAGRAG